MIKRTVDGVELARKGSLQEALKNYRSALDLDATCVEAWVAMGAWYSFVTLKY